jgi:hypothetical protein
MKEENAKKTQTITVRSKKDRKGLSRDRRNQTKKKSVSLASSKCKIIK